MRSLLGEALNQRYASTHTEKSSIMCINAESVSLILHIPYIVPSVISDKVPESPSTPSVQLVTFIETQISITARIIKSHTGIVTPASEYPKLIVVPL